MNSYNWFPGSIGPFTPNIGIAEYTFVNDLNGWTDPAKFMMTPDGVYVGPLILPPTWPNPTNLIRCRSIAQDGSGELYVFLDRGSRYFNTGKPHGSETGSLRDIITLHHAFFDGPFTEKWDLPSVAFDRNADKLTVNFIPTTVTSWVNVEFSYS